MSKPLRSRKIKTPDTGTVSKEAVQHSRYKVISAYVPFTNAANDHGHFRVSYNIDHNVFEGWLYDAEGIFDGRHEQFVADCRNLWNKCPSQRSPDFGEYHHTRALARLATLKRKVPRSAWEIFENVCRWDEPTGVPGSRYSPEAPAAVRAAKRIVRYVAEELSR